MRRLWKNEKKYEETEGKLIKKDIRGKLRKKNFYHDTEKVFERSIAQHKKSTDEMIKAITARNETLGIFISVHKKIWSTKSEKKNCKLSNRAKYSRL